MLLARKKARRRSHTFLNAIVITFIIITIRVQSTQHCYPIHTIFSKDTYLNERRASASQTMTQHIKNENKKTCLVSVTPRPFETSAEESSEPTFQSPPVPLAPPQPEPCYVWWTTTQPQLPSVLLSLQPQNPQPTSTRPNTLIIHESRKGINKYQFIPLRLFYLSWSQWEICMGSSVWRGQRHLNLASRVPYRL